MIISYPIPDDSSLLVKDGDKLDFNSPLFEKKTTKQISIDVAKELDINPKNIFRHLNKLVGEKIEKGKTIAVKNNLFSTNKVHSPEEGIIKEIDHNRGVVTIETSDKKKNKLFSPFKGEVEKVEKHLIKIHLSKAEEFDIKKASSDFGGEVFYLNPKSQFSSDEISNKIIFSENVTPFIEIKTEALGVKGYITFQPLTETTESSTAILKNIEDYKKILKLNYTYCTIIAKSAKIYFYR